MWAPSTGSTWGIMAVVAVVAFVLRGTVASALAALLRGVCGIDVLRDRKIDWSEEYGYESRHDRKRFATYPNPVSNTWYHLVDSAELVGDRVVEVRALGKTLALWRGADGKPVCHGAFCPHLGANLAVGGTVVDGTIQCPFHKWRFNADGTAHSVPYAKEGARCATARRLQTYPCVDFCGLVMVFYHVDFYDGAGRDVAPDYPLPTFVEAELRGEISSSTAGAVGAPRSAWTPHLAWDIGFVRLHPTDWVDQAGDHAHFHTLHNEIIVPWTTAPLPSWLKRLVPLSIKHELASYRGDDPAWKAKVAADGYGAAEAAYIFFTDRAGLAWRGQLLRTTVAETLEMYCGPALMIFHIPFTLGAFKVLVSTTPVHGGSVMRVRTFTNSRNPLVRALSWLLQGVSASQLAADIVIMQNRIRLRKPALQPFDGPFNRVNAWLKTFYSGPDHLNRPARYDASYNYDW